MAIDIVTEEPETYSKEVLEDHAKQFLIELIQSSLNDHDIECWSIALAENILETLKAQITN